MKLTADKNPTRIAPHMRHKQITAKQYPDGVIDGADQYTFKVIEAVNTTDPTVGHYLSKKEVDYLILLGIEVVIK